MQNLLGRVSFVAFSPFRYYTDDNLLKGAIEELVKRKKIGHELDREPNFTVINDYLEERITFFEEQVKSFDPQGSYRYSNLPLTP